MDTLILSEEGGGRENSCCCALWRCLKRGVVLSLVLLLFIMCELFPRPRVTKSEMVILNDKGVTKSEMVMYCELVPSRESY